MASRPRLPADVKLRGSQMATWYLIGLFDKAYERDRKYYPSIHPAWGRVNDLGETLERIFHEEDDLWAELRKVGTLRSVLMPQNPNDARLGAFDLGLDEKAPAEALVQKLKDGDVRAFIEDCKGACMLELVN